MKRIFSFILTVAIPLSALCQEGGDTVSYKKSSWSKRNLFISWGLSALFFDMYKGPNKTVNDTTFLDNAYYPKRDTNVLVKTYHMWGFCYVTAVITARINLKNYNDKSSVSLSVPLCISLGGREADLKSVDENNNITQNHFQNKITGLYYRVPILISYNSGYYSTYNNTDHAGTSYGAGVQATIIPIKNALSGGYENTITTWLQPVVSVAFKSDRLKLKKGVEFNMGFLNGWNFRISSIYTIGY
jgi:hypothetical protein